MRAVGPAVLVAAAWLAGSAAAADPAARAPRGAAPAPFTAAQLERARAVRDRALADDTAHDLLRSLLTEVGPRFAGTDGDARAVAWAVARLEALGFANVRAEPVTVPRWIRGEAAAEIVAPWPQPLVAAALGGSPATPAGGLEAEVVPVTTLAELERVPAERVRGRIVFFTNRMKPALDGSGYGAAVAARGRGAAEAAKLGAAAVVIRSVGTSNDRIAHTGAQRMEDGPPPIPALALSNPDADLLERQLASGRAVRLRLRNTSSWGDSARSANVIGEIPGRERAGEIVVLGAHLDSWDLTPGAHDDGAGVAIVTAAAKLIGGLPVRPRRTVRVVLFANEEFGLSGARAYVRDHAAELPRHVLCMESDLGAFRPWGLASRVPHDRLPLVRAMHEVVEPLGLRFEGNEAGGGADVGRLVELGVPALDVRTDARPYFELHHTINDTFDKVDPELLRLNVAAYAALACLAADAAAGFGRAPQAPRK
uniref:Carboxypeptidase Q n=1 Tax=Eiseniibacteriota bacterium TaxID=2212470 RepID=A0A832I4P2_UNCEI